MDAYIGNQRESRGRKLVWLNYVCVYIYFFCLPFLTLVVVFLFVREECAAVDRFQAELVLINDCA